jgi:hypothetical protein
MAESVKPNLFAKVRITKRPKRRATLGRLRGRSLGLRSYLIALILLVPAAAGQGCATQGQATRAAEQAAMKSEDDTACRQQGAPDSPAYHACRKELAEARARAQQAAIQEQKRRDFDRVLGAGTEGQSNY